MGEESIADFLSGLGMATNDKIDIDALVGAVGPAPDLSAIPEDESLPPTPSRCHTPAGLGSARDTRPGTPLDAERLMRLVQRGSSASDGSDWEQLDAELQRRMQELDNIPGASPKTLNILSSLEEEGASLRAEREKLWREHQELLASEEVHT